MCRQPAAGDGGEVQTSTRNGRVTAVLVLIWVAWVLAPLLLAGAAVASGISFLGEQPTAAELAQADRLFVAAAVLLAGATGGVRRDRGRGRLGRDHMQHGHAAGGRHIGDNPGERRVSRPGAAA